MNSGPECIPRFFELLADTQAATSVLWRGLEGETGGKSPACLSVLQTQPRHRSGKPHRQCANLRPNHWRSPLQGAPQTAGVRTWMGTEATLSLASACRPQNVKTEGRQADKPDKMREDAISCIGIHPLLDLAPGRSNRLAAILRHLGLAWNQTLARVCS